MKSVYFVTVGLHGGGAERVMSVIANYLSRKNYSVNFIMLRNVPEEYVLDEKVIRHYKPVSNKKDIIGDIKYIRSFMKKDPGAVFISFFTYQSFYTILAAFGTKAEVIVSERNDPSKTVKGKVDNFIRNILYKCKLCKKIVFQTTGAKEYFDQAIQGKGEIILNPLKKEVENIQWNPEYKEIVAVGRLTEQKNYPMLIESFAQFANLYPDYKLRIFGQGELEGQLLKLASRMNVENKVVFEGFCSNVHQQIKSAGMFVMSSDYEGLSNALLEAMAIGLPCISTDSPPGGARMVIESGVNGILVPVGDIASMTKAMKKVANDIELAHELGNNAKKIVSRISENAICHKWEKLINSL